MISAINPLDDMQTAGMPTDKLAKMGYEPWPQTRNKALLCANLGANATAIGWH
jgi:hypothetical protein